MNFIKPAYDPTWKYSSSINASAHPNRRSISTNAWRPANNETESSCLPYRRHLPACRESDVSESSDNPARFNRVCAASRISPGKIALRLIMGYWESPA